MSQSKPDLSNPASSNLASSPIFAISPLDGRYATKVKPLAPLMSEYGYMQRRIQVELTWFAALSTAGLSEFAPLSPACTDFLRQLINNFSESNALTIKAIERVTNHDVKAVEYWIVEQFKAATHLPELAEHSHFVHFACTSEDINNTSHALQIKAARATVLVPALQNLLQTLADMSSRYADSAMLARTHGQSATPTTVGKELANVVARLQRCLATIEAVPLLAKMNGAVGNYNAHLAAYPDFDWQAFSRQVVESPETLKDDSASDALKKVPASNASADLLCRHGIGGLGLGFQDYSTQIEPHDYIAELFHALMRCNTVLIDLSRDIWGYVSLGYFKQRLKEGEIGSSTMPHKVNPIDFENAEGNLGLANALMAHMADKLPISRWQRDLSDSTVLRNIGVGMGYSLLAYESLLSGLGKLQINEPALAADLDTAWEVLAEPIQTVMRRYGVDNAYEQLKEATRGKSVLAADLHRLIENLPIAQHDKDRLLALSPANYIGQAAELARAKALTVGQAKRF